ncbi:hypothetical protein ACFL3E_01115 [Patescibacteria group bacterium]
MDIVIDRECWHAKLFFFSVKVWDRFCDTSTADRYIERTNICHYIRVMCVWMPMVIFLNLMFYTVSMTAVVALPIYLFGIAGYAKTIGVIAGVMALFVIVILCVAGFSELGGWAKGKFVEIVEEKKRRRDGTGFAEVVKQYVISKKMKICPPVEFRYSETEEA